MKTDITFGEYHIAVDAPEEVHFVGISVKQKGTNYSLITGVENTGAIRQDQEIILGDGIKITLHNYSSPELSEMSKELNGFKGMKFAEIHSGKLHLFQII